MKSLKIQNIEKKFGSFTALKNINLDIEAGKFLILVGPSGCGKSTLLSIIAGLEPVTSGRIFIGNTDATSLEPKDRDIAMVFQSYALYPNMTIRKNISFGLEMHKVPTDEQEKIVKEVAEMLQIEPLLERKPSQLSGGQRQRVAMGRALARDPSLFLFDEPLSNLDAKLRVEMRARIKELHQRTKTTMVYVTHDQIEAMTLGDVIAVMKDGEIQQFGTPKAIYDNPDNLFVAGFMGSPSMNFIPCNVRDHEGNIVLEIKSASHSYMIAVDHLSDGLDRYINKQVLFGLRPEQISDLPRKNTPNNATENIKNNPVEVVMDCKVNFIEPTGPDTLISVQLNNTKVTCRIHPDTDCFLEDVIPLKFDLSKAVFFDPKTEERII
ncbi:MAG: ABC transporter ATP-binding protein [Cocleimonas sp.]